ncbi:MAG: hypothetical protein NTW95_00970 [Candidatus Aminicenantes bacterium]|nr:hypothetical protein [Candidatus Aminicenantes bacterium]
MKKRIAVLSVGLVVFMIAFVMAVGLFANPADDYKVIKNAVKSSKSKDGDRENVKISLPLSLVEMIINACPEEKFKLEHGCQIDIRKIWNELKKAGPQALVEVEDHGETVKIWFE